MDVLNISLGHLRCAAVRTEIVQYILLDEEHIFESGQYYIPPTIELQ